MADGSTGTNKGTNQSEIDWEKKDLEFLYGLKPVTKLAAGYGYIEDTTSKYFSKLC